MDPFHERLARIGLDAISDYGFCLAGGYAVEAHGFLERRSDDVDLFTTMDAERDFATAVKAAVSAYRQSGLDVEIVVESETFARLQVSDPQTGQVSKVELGIDWRAHPPTQLPVGPVLHPDDAVANKIGALYSRGEVRDYIDIDAVLRSGRYTSESLLTLAADHDPGFNRDFFVQALAAVNRLPGSAFEPYHLTPPEAAALQDRLTSWAEAIAADHS